jgi:hypothetical protein
MIIVSDESRLGQHDLDVRVALHFRAKVLKLARRPSSMIGWCH